MARRIMLAIALLLAAAAVGCTKGDEAVVARVNKAKITAADLKHQMEGLENPQVQMSVATDAKARKEFLDDLIGIELVVQEAKRQGLDRDPEFKKRQEAMRREMEQQYQNAMRNDLFRGLLKKELKEKLDKVAPPTDKEIREFYEKNRSRMVNMSGKQLPLKDVAPRLREVLLQQKQRDLYLEFTKGLKEKANVSVDEKALEAAFAPATAPTASGEPAAPHGAAAPKTDEPKK